MNKKYALFGVAAVVAIAGVIYFGTGANQQASVANTKAVRSNSSTFPTDCKSTDNYSTKTGQPCTTKLSSLQIFNADVLKEPTSTIDQPVSKEKLLKDAAAANFKVASTAPISERKKVITYYQAGEYCLIYLNGGLIGGGSFTCP